MVLDWINVYIEALKSEPQWLMLLIFLVAFVEAFALVGVVVPGVVILFALSMAVGFEPKLFLLAWASASLGAFLGDSVSFQLGRNWQPKRQGELLDRARALFHDHGGKSIFLGRFIGPVRPVIPLVGGMLAVRWRTFLIFALPACVLWAPVYLLPGMIFGASIEMAAQVAGRLAVVLVLLVIGTWFGLWLVRTGYGFAAKRSSWWLKRLIQWGQRHPLLGRWISDLLRPGSREVMAIGFLGLLWAFSVSALVVLLVMAPSLMPQWTEPFHPATWASSLRNPWADVWMVNLSLVGDVWVVAWLGGLMMGVFLITRRWVAAGHWAVALIGVYALASLINTVMAGWVIESVPSAVPHPTLTQLPHRGFALWVTTISFFALMVAKDLSARARKWPYLIATLISIPVGFSHFYLELASLPGLATAVALALGWSALTGIGYRHRARITPFRMRWVGVFLVSGLFFSTTHIHLAGPERLANSEVPLTLQTMTYQMWSKDGWQSLPKYRSVFGSPLERQLDFQVAGDLKSIEARLYLAGWQRVPAMDWVDWLSGLADQPLPWPRALNGRREALLMTRSVSSSEQIDVLRLWESGVVLSGGAGDQMQTVWLGQVRRATLQAGLMGVRRWEDGMETEPLDALNETLEALPMLRVRPHDFEPSASSDPIELQGQ